MTAPLIPRQVLFGNPERISPAVSPDGTRLGWIAPREGVLNVWVAPLSDLSSAEAITDDRDRGIRRFAWAHDGRTLLYVQDRGGDENWRLHGVDLTTGETRDLTPFDGVQAQLVAIDHLHPEHVLVGLNRENAELHDVYRLELATGELTRIAANPGFVGWVADADFVVRAGVAPTPDGGTVLMVRDPAPGRDEGAGEWRPLLTAGPEDALTTAPLAFSLDGATLLAISSIGVDTGRLVRLDLASGEVLEELASDPAADVAGVDLDPDTRLPRAVTFVKDRSELVVLDPAIAPDVEALSALRPGDLRLVAHDDADTRWVVAHVVDDGPVTYSLWDRASRAATTLFTHQPALERYELATMEPFEVTARDGLRLHGYLTWPTTVPASEHGSNGHRRLPAVLNVHGGPWARD
ncbi:MAG: PD40 domain-containing protein, partial [Acidimicrobiaceae bacterium]|nr:PD40 domain-containing protein [Acidimicrobiaceae bacterium]